MDARRHDLVDAAEQAFAELNARAGQNSVKLFLLAWANDRCGERKVLLQEIASIDVMEFALTLFIC